MYKFCYIFYSTLEILFTVYKVNSKLQRLEFVNYLISVELACSAFMRKYWRTRLNILLVVKSLEQKLWWSSYIAKILFFYFLNCRRKLIQENIVKLCNFYCKWGKTSNLIPSHPEVTFPISPHCTLRQQWENEARHRRKNWLKQKRNLFQTSFFRWNQEVISYLSPLYVTCFKHIHFTHTHVDTLLCNYLKSQRTFQLFLWSCTSAISIALFSKVKFQ